MIVPIYNVERFLRECLESVRVQSYPDIEVIMVNDGSPDNSEAIAREFAERDRRFKLITKQNAGLGAARNTGIRAATGKYITFLDSDDAVTPDAYKDMVLALNRSGSDFVVGGVERWRARATWRDDWVTRVHGRDQLRAKLEDIPEVTKDVFAWNKMFNTDFFRDELGEFPEGILYEDQELTARAFTRSRSFDLLEATTYLWRIREDGTSITQGKLTERDLRDRIKVAHRVNEIYREDSSPEVYSYWKQKTADLDFSFYYRLSHRGSSEYWSMLVDFTRFLREILTREEWEQVPVQHRVLVALISTDDRDESERVINAQAQYAGDLPTIVTDGRLAIDLSRWDIANNAVPEFVQVLQPIDTPLRTGLRSVSWERPGVLEVSGFAYVDKFPADIDSSELSIFAVLPDGSEIPLTVERQIFEEDDPSLPRTAYAEYPASGFRTVLNGRELLEAGDGQVSLRVEATVGAVRRDGPLVPQNNENSFGRLPSSVEHEALYVARADRRDGLVLGRIPLAVSVGDLSIEGRDVEFTLASQEGLSSAVIRFTNLTMLKQVEVTVPSIAPGGKKRISAHLPLRARAWGKHIEHVWRAELITDGSIQPLPYPGGDAEILRAAESGALAIRPGELGTMELFDSRWRVVVRDIRARGSRIEVSGQYSSQVAEYPQLLMLRVDGMRLAHDTFDVDLESGWFSATFVQRREPKWGMPYVSTTSGVFGLCMMIDEADDPFESSVPLYFENRQLVGHRAVQPTEAGRVEVTDFGFDRSVLLRLQGPLPPTEWSLTRNRRALDAKRSAASSRPLLERVALCLSFSGASVDDSPRPIAEQLLSAGLVDEVVWGVRSMDQDPGDGSRAVPVDSAEFIEILHRAKYLINNAHFPHYFRKRDEQIYVQTWHGTPLKKIANDVPATSLSNQYRDLMSREVLAWDLLLAQSPEAGQLLANAFGYAGPVLAAGYPRNDVFFQPKEMEELRDSFRKTHGIGANQTVVLYAPTWRDNAASGIAGAGYEEIDLPRVLDALGNDARLLMRGHANTLSFDRSVGDKRVLDVSGVSDLAGIIAASDMLITDYSSIFFDYLLTGKPVVGFVPDLDNYVATTRGTYFEYGEVFPGPIARTNAELVEVLSKKKASMNLDAPIIAGLRKSDRGVATNAVIGWFESQA